MYAGTVGSATDRLTRTGPVGIRICELARGSNLVPGNLINCAHQFLHMEFPDRCPHCERSTDRHGMAWMEWMPRGKLCFEEGDAGQIGDPNQIFECSECGTLFRARWTLSSFKELKEVESK